MVEKLLYSSTEAAQVLCELGYPLATPRTLARLAAEGKGPPFARVANKRFYKREALVEFVESALATTYTSITAEKSARKAAPVARKVAPAQHAAPRPAPRKRGA